MLKVSLDKKRPEKENMVLKFERFWWTFRKHKIRSILRGINIQIILFAFMNIPQRSPFNSLSFNTRFSIVALIQKADFVPDSQELLPLVKKNKENVAGKRNVYAHLYGQKFSKVSHKK